MFIKLTKSNLILFLIVLCILLSSISVFGQEDNISKTEVNLSWFEKYDIQSSSPSINKLGSSAQENEAYSRIKDGLIGLDDNINMEDLNLNKEQLSYLMKKVLVDNPDIFYINSWVYYSYKDSGIMSSVSPTYNYNENTIISMTNEIDSKVNYILNSVIKNGMTDFQKELAIHDYLVLNSKYDPNKLSNGKYANESYSVYGILVRGVGVCGGYAESFKLLLNKVGIESMVVISTPEMNHAWNIVNLDGEYYHVDVTWDDPTPDREGITGYSYLNLTDTKIREDHYWDNRKYPSCTSNHYSELWDIYNPIVKDNNIYYSSNQNYSEYIYKLDQDTLIKKQLTTDRAPYFTIVGDSIYFSNYSEGAEIYKMNINGSDATLFHDVASKNIYSVGNRIYFTEYYTGVKRYIEIGSESLVKFKDIKNHWAKNDIEFVATRGLFNGTGEDKFSPEISMTRGMFVTVLGRFAEADISNYKKSSFVDVKLDAYYMGYVEWANKNNVVKGIGGGKFDPEGPITREQMAVVMSNYAETIGYNLPKIHKENIFTDNEEISGYAKSALKEIQIAGIILGKDNNKVDPQGKATRAEVSAVLKRFVEIVESK